MPIDPLRKNNVRVLGKAGPAIVLGHGFGTDQRAWRHIVSAFEHSHRIVLFDHVGFGGSDPMGYQERRHATLEGYAQDLLDILTALALDDVAYVGHSVGAVIGTLACIAQPARFRRLIALGMSPRFLDDPPDYAGGFDAEQIEGLLDLMERDQIAWADALTGLAMGGDGTSDATSYFGDSLRALDPLFTRRFARLAFMVDVRALLPRISVPMLAVHCTRDSIVPRDIGQYLRRNVPSCTLIELEGSGHCPHLSHPRETADAIAGWLEMPA